MARSAAIRRQLFMHPAHPTVGVLGTGSPSRPYYRIASIPADAEAGPTLVAMVVDRRNPDALAALRLFEESIGQRYDIECGRVDLDAVDAEAGSLVDADCVAVFGRGLCLAGCWSDVDAAAFAADGLSEDRPGPINVEMASAARQHPLLDGVQPFFCARGSTLAARVPADATVLLTARTLGGVHPAAWVRHGHGRVFCTQLGRSDDFRHPAFVRLLLNVLAWIDQ